MKILNLYAGIGGNRKQWGDKHEITAVEINSEIADIYKSQFPNDNIIVTDAHQYLIDNYKNYDFIWSSPPCPSHSRSRFWGMNRGYKPIYPDMKLYEEILLLTHYFKGKWIVENVIPFYKPLINAEKIGRHFYWTNLKLNIKIDVKPMSHIQNSLKLLEDYIGINVSRHKYNGDKRVLLRNCVEPQIGKAILNVALKIKKEVNVEQNKLF